MTDWIGTDFSQPRRRGYVALQALLYTPLALLTLAGAVYAVANIASGHTGFFVMLSVTGVLFVVFGYQAFHFLRDLGAETVMSEGEISKKWTKGNLFFFLLPSYYVAVKGQIYSIKRTQYAGLLEEDLVRIYHYPHSLTVEHLERYDEVEKKYVPADDNGAAKF